MSDQFALSEAERRDALWLRLKAYMEGRLQQHRVSNDSDKTPDATAKLRGRIAELNYLIDLDRPVEHVPVEPGD